MLDTLWGGALLGYLERLPAGGPERFLLDALWQTTLIAGMGLIVARLVASRPALRATALLTTATLCIVAPLASLAVRGGGWGMLTATATTTAAKTPLLETPRASSVPTTEEAASAVWGTSENIDHATLPEPEPLLETSIAATLPNITATREPRRWSSLAASVNWPALLGGAWLLASLVVAWRLMRSGWRLRKILKAGIRCEQVDILSAVDRAKDALRIEREVRVVWSDAVSTPATTGWFGGCLLLPLGCATRSDWFGIAAHELAHLKRRDGSSALWLELVSVMLPWQPLAWLLKRHWRQAADEACDQWAVVAGEDPVELAATLASWIPTRRQPLAMAMADSPRATRRRIARLLSGRKFASPTLSRASGLALVLGAALSCGALALAQSPPGAAVREQAPVPVESVTREAAPEVSSADALDISPVATTEAMPDEPATDQQPPVFGDFPLAPGDELTLTWQHGSRAANSPRRIQPGDVLLVDVEGALPEHPVPEELRVSEEGRITLGAIYGKVSVAEHTIDEATSLIVKHLQEIIREPSVSIEFASPVKEPTLPKMVIIDRNGNVRLGNGGQVGVAGMNVAMAEQAITATARQTVGLDVRCTIQVKYRDRFYYLIAKSSNSPFEIERVRLEGGERVIDALSSADGGGNAKVSLYAGAVVTISRPAGGNKNKDEVLKVDWEAILLGTDSETNYELRPGDKVVVNLDAAATPPAENY
jgi:protein involved in polysaccharide export with SLBB domain